MRFLRASARLTLGAAVAVIAFGVLQSSASAASKTVTLGSTSGTPNYNICFSGIRCTYVPFSSVSNPGLQVPFDGTVTSFSVNSGSSGNLVELRVLSPASGGQYTGAGTSPAETLNGGLSTFTASLPVKAGDVLGLDNDSSALMFDNSSTTALTAYYMPALADGQTGAPTNNQMGYRLLLSAVVTESPPHGTKITKSKIKKTKHKAVFKFTASGTVTGFQCELKKPHKKHASYSSCSSPKTYKHLAPGHYKFKVRAVNSAGPDPSPATKTFSIP